MKTRMSDGESASMDLIHRLPLLAREQLSRNECRYLGRQVAAGFVEQMDLSTVVVRHVELLAIFQPGDEADWAGMAQLLAQRWNLLMPETARVFWASTRGVRAYGGRMSGHCPKFDCVTHDLGLAATVRWLFGANPAFRNSWVPEVLFDDVYRQAKPDGGIASSLGLHALVEFCGIYREERLTRLGALAERMNLPLLLFTAAAPGGGHELPTLSVA
jgi:hypothetical protein